ncbi:MAG: hypothetical protein NVS3B17_14500 [Vulcanimicrobiaceae bacterium]
MPASNDAPVSGFREHFLDKYFAYRRRYVEGVAARAPHRRSWAVVSEIARLGFMIVGNVLCAAIFWLLTFAAFGRGGPGVLSLTFLALAALPTIFAALATRGIATAIAERARLQRGEIR